MKLSDATIGYAGYSRDWSGPGDRRRFCAYAAIRGLAFQPARLSSDLDAVLVTHNGDISGWTARKRHHGDRLKFLFELCDGYFAQTNPVRRLLKGTARYALGTESRLSPDFLKTLIRACETADVVLCSTEEQRDTISRYNRNVVISFDYFADELGPPKADYRPSDRLRIVWEGQSTTLPNLQVIRGLLNDFRDRIELHVVTDPLIYRHFGRFNSYPAMDALAGIECPKIFHPWDRDSFSNRITACDLAVIPIERRNALWWAKPENKLILLWQLGMPVLTTRTPSYERTMREAGVDMSCATTSDWAAKLEGFLGSNADQRRSLAAKYKAFAQRAYSRDEFASRFDRAFELAGFSTG